MPCVPSMTQCTPLVNLRVIEIECPEKAVNSSAWLDDAEGLARQPASATKGHYETYKLEPRRRSTDRGALRSQVAQVKTYKSLVKCK